ncbi:hypothetical protein RQN30_02360 [Arcanobacterium hippocoleae]
MKMGSKPSAAWSLKSLLRSLALSGWGALAGAKMRHCRSVLNAFGDILPSGSAEGISTAWQLSIVSGYSERHTRKALQTLEELGLITWVRGGIQEGKPAPSFFRVVKRKLVEIIMRAKEVLRGSGLIMSLRHGRGLLILKRSVNVFAGQIMRTWFLALSPL